MSIRRYDPDCYSSGQPYMQECADGDYVRYEDHAAEVEEYRQDAMEREQEMRKVAEKRDALAAEVEGLRADAERYRWLRAEHGVNSPLAHVSWKRNYERQCGVWVNTESPESLDAAIDAARTTGGEGHE